MLFGVDKGKEAGRKEEVGQCEDVKEVSIKSISTTLRVRRDLRGGLMLRFEEFDEFDTEG